MNKSKESGHIDQAVWPKNRKGRDEPPFTGARLLYMSVSQEAVDRLMGKGKIKIPPVVMAETNKPLNEDFKLDELLD